MSSVYGSRCHCISVQNLVMWSKASPIGLQRVHTEHTHTCILFNDVTLCGPRHGFEIHSNTSNVS